MFRRRNRRLVLDSGSSSSSGSSSNSSDRSSSNSSTEGDGPQRVRLRRTSNGKGYRLVPKAPDRLRIRLRRVKGGGGYVLLDRQRPAANDVVLDVPVKSLQTQAKWSNLKRVLLGHVRRVREANTCSLCSFQRDGVLKWTTLCEHQACGKCVSRYVREVTGRKAFPVLCPECTEPVPAELFDLVLPGADAKRFTAQQVLGALHADNKVTCNSCQAINYRDTDQTGRLRCAYCSEAICAVCGKRPHPGRSCVEAEVQARPWTADEIRSFIGQSKPCPNCGELTVHPHGHACHHIKPGSGCPKCGTHWCFMCLRNRTRDGPCGCPTYCNYSCGCVPCNECSYRRPCKACDVHMTHEGCLVCWGIVLPGSLHSKETMRRAFEKLRTMRRDYGEVMNLPVEHSPTFLVANEDTMSQKEQDALFRATERMMSGAPPTAAVAAAAAAAGPVALAADRVDVGDERVDYLVNLLPPTVARVRDLARLSGFTGMFIHAVSLDNHFTQLAQHEYPDEMRMVYCVAAITVLQRLPDDEPRFFRTATPAVAVAAPRHPRAAVPDDEDDGPIDLTRDD